MPIGIGSTLLFVLAMRLPFVPDHFHFASEGTVGVYFDTYVGHDNDCSVRRSEHSFVLGVPNSLRLSVK